MEPFEREPFTRPGFTKVITFRVNRDEWEVLCDLSHQHSMTLSELLREGMKEVIKKIGGTT